MSISCNLTCHRLLVVGQSKNMKISVVSLRLKHIRSVQHLSDISLPLQIRHATLIA